MRSSPLKRTQTRANHGLFHGEGLRALIAAATLGGIFLMVFFMAANSRYGDFAGSYRSRGSTLRASGTGEPLQPSTGDKAAHRLGSILLVPWRSTRCEERHFDNFTGVMVSADYIDCDARLTREIIPPSQLKFGRMQGILDAFKK